MKTYKILLLLLLTLAGTALKSTMVNAQTVNENSALDEKVKKFLKAHEGKWHDLNVHAVDGQIRFTAW